MNWGHLAASLLFGVALWIAFEVAAAAFRSRRQYLEGRRAYHAGEPYSFRWSAKKGDGFLDAKAQADDRKPLWKQDL
jgi:hypothetical protein